VEFLVPLLERLSRSRPIFFSSDPAEYASTSRDKWWSERMATPTGMAFEIRHREQPIPPQERAAWNGEFWRAGLSHLPPVRPHADLETETIQLEYALALLHCGRFAQRQGMNAQALELCRAIGGFDTDACELDLQRAYARMGRSIPLNHFAEQARSAVSVLSRSSNSR
jgi:hypothetical protein